MRISESFYSKREVCENRDDDCFYVFIYLFIWWQEGQRTTFPFYHVGLRDHTQAVRLGGKCLSQRATSLSLLPL